MKRSFAINLVGTLLGVLAVLVLARPAHAQETPVTTTVYLPSVQQFRITQPIAAGWAHTCAIRPGGRVRCWGNNDHGQLGDGTTISSTLPVSVQGLPPAHAVAAWGDTTCAAAGDGVYCWGESYAMAPQAVVGVPASIELALYPTNYMPPAPPARGCALGSNGTVTCWTPGALAGRFPGLAPARRLAPGLFECAVTEAGALQCWEHWWKAAPPGVWLWPGVSGVVAAASSGRFSPNSGPFNSPELEMRVCFATAPGDVTCWSGGGDGYQNQVDPAPPGPPLAEHPIDAVPGAVNLRALSVGGAMCGLRSDDRVVCWPATWNGLGRGEGGLGTATGYGQPALGVEGAVAVAVGGEHACAQDTGGHVWCWGSNAWGQLGSTAVIQQSSQPLRVPLDAIQTVFATDLDTCSVNVHGGVYCWGHYRALPEQIPVPAPAASVAVDARICALLPGAGIWCHQPTQADEGAGVWVRDSAQAVTMALAGDWLCFVADGGRVWCSDDTQAAPRRVEGLRGVRSLALSINRGCAVADGSVSCWRWPSPYGASLPEPEAVPGLRTAHKVALAYGHACAVHGAGRVSCWGDNGYGQLGDGTTVSRATPALVPGLSDVTAVAVDDARSCALRADGTVLCWGGVYGQGSTAAPLFQVEGATALAIGWSHACVVADGSLWCVGDNSRGQLAQNPGWTPVRVEGLDE
jgi:alpha-tubulin suppressor-like RCC1 family protein